MSMEYLKQHLGRLPSVLSREEYEKIWKEEKLASLVDYILEKDWIEDEKCSWKKENIWEVNWNEVFVYNISDKYITENSAYVFIYIWNRRKNKYKLNFEYNLWKMITWDYSEDRPFRLENVVLKQNIFIQNKENKKWYQIWEPTKELKYELTKIRELIVKEYLNPYFSCKN